jgi:hypothetical protein
MQLNLNDPESIVTWWKVLPDQHSAHLDDKIEVSPEFAPAIMETHRRIAEEPEPRGLLAQAIQRRRQGEADRAAHDGDVPAHELRRREFATA